MPISAGICFFEFNHCSMKITTNKAVITKSIPFGVAGNKKPITAPKAAPVIQ